MTFYYSHNCVNNGVKIKLKICYWMFFLCDRLQDSLEFIGQDPHTLRPDHNNSLLGNIGNHDNTSTVPDGHAEQIPILSNSRLKSSSGYE